jgi:hypothetical protein
MKNLILILLIALPKHSQAQHSTTGRLNVFIDCSNTWCDMTFIRSEITVVNFSLDRLAADMHVLVTSTTAGGGGERFQVIFYGQNKFAKNNDTLAFLMSPVSTDFERREMLVKHIKMGLAPAIAKTSAVDEVSIDMKSDKAEEQSNKSVTDKWNYWVYRVSLDGSFSSDQNYKSGRLSGRLSANRTTDKSKISVYTNGGKNRAIYYYDGKTIVDNHNAEAGHYFIKSFGPKWGGGYETNYGTNTFSNIKGRLFVRSALEYNFFPYSEVNNKLFTVSYGPFIQYNNYLDTTIFSHTQELLYGHMLLTSLTLNQKWGTIGIGAAHRNYFHNWKFYNVGAIVNVNVRITGGLSFYVDFYGNVVHDQIYLSGEGVDKEDVLTRRRQLESNYNFQTWFGLTYRFGSILNNFVNPRFDGPGNWIF